MTENMAGTLAYVTAIPAIIFLIMEPYKGSRFVRFHAWQCIFVCGTMILAHIALGLIAMMVGGPFLVILTIPLHVLLSGAACVALIFLAVKANQGQTYKLPVLGDLAEKQSTA